MTQWQWLVSAAVVAAALVIHVAFPRYEFHLADGLVLRVDRWHGTVEATAVVGEDLNATSWGKWIEAKP